MNLLSLVNLVLINLTLIVLSMIGTIKSNLGGNNFLLFVDLMILTSINSIITIFFLVK
jgi:hypothetical protein